MTKEERAIDLEKTRLSMVLLPIDIVQEIKERDKHRGNPKRPYIIIYDESSALADQAAVPDPIEIDNDNDDNDNDNDNPDDDLFSTNSDDDNGGNDPDDDNDPDEKYSQSTDDEKKNKNKRSKRKTPTSAIRSPRMITGQA